MDSHWTEIQSARVMNNQTFLAEIYSLAPKTIEDKPGVLLAAVGVQDYGDKLNDDLRERFAVSSDLFPKKKFTVNKLYLSLQTDMK